ncbi:hypothetical protein ASF62_15435 [Leifsonia sp. Leaf325]|nr:hypothetical protein [Leifsonia sp. Leaf325]KQQ93129.1 hypothetical protein ASF62_15435 [Leifsonia sp. Leaf325]
MPILTAGAIVAVGSMVGTGFVLQSAVTAQNERNVATAAFAQSTGLHSEQLGTHGGILEAQATKSATVTLANAQATVAAAKDKTDASTLSTQVAALGHYELLAPQRVFELVDDISAEAHTVAAATAEVNRIAAEKAAAEAAAAAAAAAAAEAAAAEASASAEPASSGSRPSAPSNPSEAQAIARDMMASQYGWGDDQFGCLVPLWDKESGWNANAYNASSGAGGIPQALPASKMASAGADWATNPATQISWGLGYIAGRYGSPCAAWDTSEAQGWY